MLQPQTKQREKKVKKTTIRKEPRWRKTKIKKISLTKAKTNQQSINNGKETINNGKESLGQFQEEFSYKEQTPSTQNVVLDCKIPQWANVETKMQEWRQMIPQLAGLYLKNKERLSFTKSSFLPTSLILFLTVLININ